MARVTARQAFTRAKSKRTKDKSASDRALLEARRRYIRQLGQVGIQVEGASQLMQEQDRPVSKAQTNIIKKRPSPTRNAAITSRKITDYFAVTKNLDLITRVRKPMARITSTRDQNGVEVITIDEDDSDIPDSNNNHDNNENNNISLETLNSSDWSSSSGGSTPGSSKNGDIKPLRCKLDLSNLGKSFDELNLRVPIDEDIEIVDMLPPIPLRNHPVFDIDDM